MLWPPWLSSWRYWWFSKESLYVSHDGRTAKVEWPAFNQYSHLWKWPTSPNSVLSMPSLPEPRGGSLLAFLAVELEILLVCIKNQFRFFLMNLVWEHGRHSTNIRIWCYKRVVPSLYYPCRACRNHEEECRRLLRYRIADLGSFEKDFRAQPSINLGRMGAI
jgi:hypothetical protein